MNITLQNLSFKSLGTVNSKKHKKQDEQVFVPVVRPPQTIPQSLLDKNYNSLLVKKSNINFGSSLPAVPNNIPIGKKIASAMQILKDEDLILVGNNAQEAKDLLKESVKSVNKVIKRLFLIEDNSVKGAFAITQNDGIPSILNLNKKPIFLKDDKQQYIVKKGDSCFFTERDKIVTDGIEINLEENEKDNLSMIRALSVKPFDFSKQDNKIIENLNAKHLEQIGAEADIQELGRKVTFADVGGQDKAIAELKKGIIYPVKYPSAYKNNIVNRGFILTGGPGTGKTLLAEALANEVDAHFIQLNGLEMESKWVGESEENWRNLFADAKEHQPSIIFIDEFDAVAKKREGSTSSRYDDKVVNQLLTLMSDAEKGKMGNVFVVVATNKLDLLDEAVTRSGRFGKHIPVEKPDLKGCKQIFDIHSKNKPVSEKVNVDDFVQKLYGQKTSGADIAHIVNEANTKAYDRLGIFEKMELGTFDEKDIDELKIEPEDFENALNDFKAQNQAKATKERAIVGYKRYEQSKEQTEPAKEKAVIGFHQSK